MSARVVARLTLILLAIVAVMPDIPAAQGRREVRVGVVGVPVALDPAAGLDGASPLIARHVFDTLLTYREGSTDIDAGLAVRWSVSRDGLTWSFTLRDNAKFHDGAAVTANDVALSFGRHLRPDGEVPPALAWTALLRGNPGVMKDVRAPDARTVQIVLAQPYAPLLTVLAHPSLAIARRGTGENLGRFVGSGPYRVVDASPGRMALEAVPGHWAGPSRNERLVFLEVGNDDHAEGEFDARSLDVWFSPGPPRRADWALSAPGLRVGYLAFQTEKEPFSRKRVRQAVAAALDPSVLGVALDRAGVPLQSFLPFGVWARREGSPILGGSRDHVKKLLAEGGWPAGYKSSLIVVGDGGAINMAKLGETVGIALGAADIPVNVRTETPTGARAALQTGDYDIALTEAPVTGGDPHLFLFPLSTSEGIVPKSPAPNRPLNFSFYRNPRLDDALIRASQLAFRPERQRLYHRAQAMLADEMPWIPIYVRLQWAVVRPEVRGLRLHPTGLHRLDALTFGP
ncbi:MAG TPA: ABC transporter substrate-binding protein [Terriglobales bacterium]|nr:ABC transporter substrate-binding protein [Terriglobales bacterium]